MATRLVSVRITVEHRDMLRELLQAQIEAWTLAAEDLRQHLATSVRLRRKFQNREPKRSDFSDLLPFPDEDFRADHDHWQQVMDEPMEIVGMIRLLQKCRREARDVLKDLS
jgi:hypothetical protein